MVENPLKRLLTNNNTEENNPKKRKINEEKTNTQNKGKKSIKLYCPVVSKIREIMAWEDQKLDIGLISSLFGIEPGTLRLNGHFISRGVDLIASSVTWNALVSYFSNKGLSTGIDPSAALVVHGKLRKSGSKRNHEPTESDKGADGGVSVCRCSRHEENNSPDSKKLKTSNAIGRGYQSASDSDTGMKRRHCVEDTSPLKKTRVSGSNENDKPQVLERDCQTARRCDTGQKKRHWLDNTSPLKKVRVSGSYLNQNPPGRGVNGRSYINNLQCGYQMNENMKRLRVDEAITANSYKKMR